MYLYYFPLKNISKTNKANTPRLVAAATIYHIQKHKSINYEHQ